MGYLVQFLTPFWIAIRISRSEIGKGVESIGRLLGFWELGAND